MTSQETSCSSRFRSASWSLFLVFVWGSVCFCQAPKVVVRVSTTPKESALVGQRIKLLIDVLAEDAWANLPASNTVEIPGTIIYSPASQSVRLSEQIQGASYTGQRYEHWIYPQRPGNLDIPSFNLSVEVKTFGVGEKPTLATSKTDPITLKINYPDGVEPLPGLVCAEKLDVVQNWNPAAGDFRVGDGITRSIRRTISGAPGMLLAPIEFSETTGTSIYPKQPEIDDSINRGSLTGKRSESATYVFQEPGNIELPAINLAWWDSDAKQLKTLSLEGLTLDVAPANGSLARASAQESSEDQSSTTIPISTGARWAIGIAVSVAALGIWYRDQIKTRLNHLFEQYQTTEYALHKQFVSTTRYGNPKSALRALTKWWDTADSNAPAPRLDLFFETYGDAESTNVLESLQKAAEGSKDSWQPEQLKTTVARARKRWLADSKTIIRKGQSSLPSLRP